MPLTPGHHFEEGLDFIRGHTHTHLDLLGGNPSVCIVCMCVCYVSMFMCASVHCIHYYLCMLGIQESQTVYLNSEYPALTIQIILLNGGLN